MSFFSGWFGDKSGHPKDKRPTASPSPPVSTAIPEDIDLQQNSPHTYTPQPLPDRVSSNQLGENESMEDASTDPTSNQPQPVPSSKPTSTPGNKPMFAGLNFKAKPASSSAGPSTSGAGGNRPVNFKFAAKKTNQQTQPQTNQPQQASSSAPYAPPSLTLQNTVSEPVPQDEIEPDDTLSTAQVPSDISDQPHPHPHPSPSSEPAPSTATGTAPGVAKFLRKTPRTVEDSISTFEPSTEQSRGGDGPQFSFIADDSAANDPVVEPEEEGPTESAFGSLLDDEADTVDDNHSTPSQHGTQADVARSKSHARGEDSSPVGSSFFTYELVTTISPQMLDIITIMAKCIDGIHTSQQQYNQYANECAEYLHQMHQLQQDLNALLEQEDYAGAAQIDEQMTKNKLLVKDLEQQLQELLQVSTTHQDTLKHQESQLLLLYPNSGAETVAQQHQASVQQLSSHPPGLTEFPTMLQRVFPPGGSVTGESKSYALDPSTPTPVERLLKYVLSHYEYQQSHHAFQKDYIEIIIHILHQQQQIHYNTLALELEKKEQVERKLDQLQKQIDKTCEAELAKQAELTENITTVSREILELEALLEQKRAHKALLEQQVISCQQELEGKQKDFQSKKDELTTQHDFIIYQKDVLETRIDTCTSDLDRCEAIQHQLFGSQFKIFSDYFYTKHLAYSVYSSCLRLSCLYIGIHAHNHQIDFEQRKLLDLFNEIINIDLVIAQKQQELGGLQETISDLLKQLHEIELSLPILLNDKKTAITLKQFDKASELTTAIANAQNQKQSIQDELHHHQKQCDAHQQYMVEKENEVKQQYMEIKDVLAHYYAQYYHLPHVQISQDTKSESYRSLSGFNTILSSYARLIDQSASNEGDGSAPASLEVALEQPTVGLSGLLSLLTQSCCADIGKVSYIYQQYLRFTNSSPTADHVNTTDNEATPDLVFQELFATPLLSFGTTFSTDIELAEYETLTRLPKHLVEKLTSSIEKLEAKQEVPPAELSRYVAHVPRPLVSDDSINVILGLLEQELGIIRELYLLIPQQENDGTTNASDIYYFNEEQWTVMIKDAQQRVKYDPPGTSDGLDASLLRNGQFLQQLLVLDTLPIPINSMGHGTIEAVQAQVIERINGIQQFIRATNSTRPSGAVSPVGSDGQVTKTEVLDQPEAASVVTSPEIDEEYQDLPDDVEPSISQCEDAGANEESESDSTLSDADHVDVDANGEDHGSHQYQDEDQDEDQTNEYGGDLFGLQDDDHDAHNEHGGVGSTADTEVDAVVDTEVDTAVDTQVDAVVDIEIDHGHADVDADADNQLSTSQYADDHDVNSHVEADDEDEDEDAQGAFTFLDDDESCDDTNNSTKQSHTENTTSQHDEDQPTDIPPPESANSLDADVIESNNGQGMEPEAAGHSDTDSNSEAIDTTIGSADLGSAYHDFALPMDYGGQEHVEHADELGHDEVSGDHHVVSDDTPDGLSSFDFLTQDESDHGDDDNHNHIINADIEDQEAQPSSQEVPTTDLDVATTDGITDAHPSSPLTEPVDPSHLDPESHGKNPESDAENNGDDEDILSAFLSSASIYLDDTNAPAPTASHDQDVNTLWSEGTEPANQSEDLFNLGNDDGSTGNEDEGTTNLTHGDNDDNDDDDDDDILSAFLSN